MGTGRFAARVMSDTPVGYWRLGEAQGSVTAHDQTANHNDGTYGGGVTLRTPGTAGDSAVLFDGATGRIAIPNSATLNPARITMEALIYWHGATLVQQRILEKESYAGITQYGLSVQPNGHVHVELRMREAVLRVVTAESTVPISSSMPTHVAATYDGVQIQIFINGEPQGTTAVNASPVDIDQKVQLGDPEVALAIGDRIAIIPPGSNLHRTFNGIIDEVALYPRALSTQQIRGHFEALFELHVVGGTDNGGMWHTVRHADGSWEPSFGDVKGQSGDPGHFAAVACAGVGDELQVVGGTDTGGMWHTVRHADGSWEPSFGDVKGQSGDPGHFAAVACAGVGDELHVVGGTDTGGMWHTVRHADGSWEPSFGDVKGQSGDPGHFAVVACAGVGDELHVVGGTDTGGMWHTVRHADGSWEPSFGDVKGQSGDPGHFAAVACAGVGDELHVVGGTDTGGMWHTVRHADGSWEPSFGDVKGQSGDPGHFAAVACAGVGDELQVVGGTDTGGMWHTVRHADGSWEPSFGDVKGQSGDPGHFAAVAAG